MGFLDHLEELRKRIVYSVIAIAVGFFACWGYAEHIYGVMQRPIMDALQRNGLSAKLVYVNPIEPFNLYLKVGCMAGLVRRLALRPLPDLVLHFARPLSQREALRHALHGLDRRPVSGRRILRLQDSSFPRRSSS